MTWTPARMTALLRKERIDQVERALRLVVEADKVEDGERILEAYFAEVLQEGRHLSQKQAHVAVQILIQEPYLSFLVFEANRAESQKFNEDWIDWKNQFGRLEAQQEREAYEAEMRWEREMEARHA